MERTYDVISYFEAEQSKPGFYRVISEEGEELRLIYVEHVHDATCCEEDCPAFRQELLARGERGLRRNGQLYRLVPNREPVYPAKWRMYKNY